MNNTFYFKDKFFYIHKNTGYILYVMTLKPTTKERNYEHTADI
jgi:hypothetical protein